MDSDSNEENIASESFHRINDLGIIKKFNIFQQSSERSIDVEIQNDKKEDRGFDKYKCVSEVVSGPNMVHARYNHACGSIMLGESNCFLKIQIF